MCSLKVILSFIAFISVCEMRNIYKRSKAKVSHAADNIQSSVFADGSYERLNAMSSKKASSISSTNFYRPTGENMPKMEACPEINCHVSLSFVLDSSGSVGIANFGDQLFFVETFLNILGLKAAANELNVCTGIVVYSTGIEIPVNPCCDNHICAIKDIIQDVPYLGSSTNTAGALKVARQMLQATSNYKKNVILITDGKSNTGGDPATIANDIREDGGNVTVIGVGDNVDKNELNAIAGPEGYAHIDTFDIFHELSDELLEKNKLTSEWQSLEEMCKSFDDEDKTFVELCQGQACKWDTFWSDCKRGRDGMCSKYKYCRINGDKVDEKRQTCYGCYDDEYEYGYPSKHVRPYQIKHNMIPVRKGKPMNHKIRPRH